MRHTLLGGIFYWLILGLSACFGTIFMLVPLLPILIFSPKWFRRVADLFITLFMSFVVCLMEMVYGVRMIVSGDRISPKTAANNLIIMNHRTRLDWMFFWACLYRNSLLSLHNMKISLKYPLKLIPGLGWATQFGAYMFLKRNFDYDKVVISDMLKYYKRVSKDVNVVYFPEGTDKCPNSTRNSHSFADKNNLPHYEYSLHPRVTGFSYVTQKMVESNLDSLYDVTIGYQDTIPQDELAITKGHFPREVHFLVKRYRREELPADEDGLQEFCRELWRDKEERLRRFYTEDHKFSSSQEEGWSDECDTPSKVLQFLTLVYWLPFTFISLYFTFTSAWVFSYVCLCIAGLLAVGPVFGGLDVLQARL